jgi:hypothetical protein
MSMKSLVRDDRQLPDRTKAGRHVFSSLLIFRPVNKRISPLRVACKPSVSDSLLSDICVWQEYFEPATLLMRASNKGFLSGYRQQGRWLSQWWLTPKFSSWLATTTLCPSRGAPNACHRDIPSESPATILTVVTGTWSLPLRSWGQEMPDPSTQSTKTGGSRSTE